MLFVAVLSLPSVVSPIGADTILKRFIKRKKEKKIEMINPEKKKKFALCQEGATAKTAGQPPNKEIEKGSSQEGYAGDEARKGTSLLFL